MAKPSYATREHVGADGDKGKSARADEVALVFTFKNGGQLRMTLDELPGNIQHALGYHGLSQKIGDEFARADVTIDDAFEAATEAWDQLKNGQWSAERGSGPRIGLFAEAVQAVKAKAGIQESLDAIKERYRLDPAKVKAMLDSRADVRAEYERIKAERAAARAKEAQDVAAKATSGSVADL